MSDSGSDGRATLRTIFAAARDPGLEPEEKVLWLLYRSYESPSRDGAFPGDELLAEHMGKGVRSVQRYRARLVERGYLERHLRGPKPALFRAVLPEGAETPPEAAEGAGQGGEDAATGDGAEEGVRTPWPIASKLPKDDAGRYVYPDAFERCWALYPDREGGNSKKGAYAAWRARVNNGADPEELEAGTRRYAAFCDAKDRTGTTYVKTAEAFYGPKDHWAEDWSVNGDGPPPDDPISSRADALAGLYGEGDGGN